jgi:ribosome maturation factor RimP
LKTVQPRCAEPPTSCREPMPASMKDPLQEFAAQVERLAEPLVESEGMRLFDVEYGSGPRGLVLKIFIDGPGGVTIDDCARISRQLGDVLDARAGYAGPYSLEVSSPGLERPLTKPKHFIFFEGQPAVLKTNRDVEGTRHLVGILAGFSGDVVKLEMADRLISVPYDALVKAHLDSKALQGTGRVVNRRKPNRS